MCRYGMTTYKPHLACFNCRKTFKRKLLKDINRDSLYNRGNEDSIAKCPECGSLMADMGLDFESPRKNDIKAWKHMEELFSVGITFHSCGCSGPGYIPIDSEAIVEHFKRIRSSYIDQQRFWARRNSEPTTQSEYSKDQNENWQRYVRIPEELKKGSKKKPKYDSLGAQKYWSDRIAEIQKKIDLIEKANYL